MSGANTAPRPPAFNLPPATQALLALNLFVFALMLVLPERTDDALVDAFGFVPARYGVALGWTAVVAPVTYQFLHAGFTHVAVNMLGLVAFGAGIEPRLGRWRYVVFYLLCGVLGALTQFVVEPRAPEAMIGASAAISGLFGGILRLAAFRRRLWLLVGLWLVMNFATGISGAGAGGEPVAWVAHLGGFFAGLALYPLFVRSEFRGR